MRPSILFYQKNIISIPDLKSPVGVSYINIEYGSVINYKNELKQSEIFLYHTIARLKMSPTFTLH